MQLTARQREFARIAGWALPISITLGAVFGHFRAQDGSVWGYIQGAVTAILISCTILLLEFAVFSRTRSALARWISSCISRCVRRAILPRSSWGLAVSAWLLRESAESGPLIERGGIIFSLVPPTLIPRPHLSTKSGQVHNAVAMSADRGPNTERDDDMDADSADDEFAP
jgi:hypothetical protein